ncbi:MULTISPECIES: hypothetical protein [unclassified Streptomyces]|uniref:hypothetical protein n=1 Tax=unclassified Streptomyces TaxID=2593676 RepID=UPI0006AE5DD2|nr:MULTISPECIES: hypothetical protein [unclassified Streptomyces]
MSTATRKGFSGLIRRGPMAADVIGRNFMTVFNAAVRDRRLSRRARGLLVEILSHRDGFGISEASLLANGPEGRDAIRTALRELEQYGYLHRRQERDEKGRMGESVFEVTDMPDGLLIGAAAPWETPREPQEENRRSEPSTENPSTEEATQNRRSEPLTDFPSTAEPSTGDPLHKKTNSSCGAEDSLSAARPARSGEDERETAAPANDRSAAAEATAPADAVVDAYRSALGRPLVASSAARVRRQATELLTAGYPVEWLSERAAEMPEHGWTDLVTHVERSRQPLPGQASPATARRRTGPASGNLSAAQRAILERASGL